ncbi:MAG: N-acetylneuraminate synthase family protein [Candidatus Paceibacterota bacterium]
MNEYTKPLIIAEIGMNHMGDEEYANQYIESLVVARPYGLTFQVREKEYYAKQEKGTSPLLTDEYYQSAVLRTNELRMRFGVGLCDVEKVPFFEEIGTDFYKILSKDIGNQELVAAVLETGKPVYVSTGMSSEDEVDSFLAGLGNPTNLSLIHTQLSYDDADTNLSAISRLREIFGVPVAFGSHSTDVHALYASLGFSPSALFFYVKGDRPIKHKDEAHAIPLAQCATVVAEIRRLETMIGDGVKQKMQNRIKDQSK